MTTFLTSDTHLLHANIIRLSNRPFADAEEMTTTIISNFNEQTTPDDTILLLGDACMGKLDDSLPWIGELHARVELYVGNHDRPSRAMQRKGDVKAKIAAARERYLEHFDEVHLDADDHVIELQGIRFAVSHYPYEGDHFDEDRFTELRPKRRGLPLLHGHVHELWKFNGPQFNVGVDVNDFQLVHEDQAVAWAGTL